jgi:hypothetical protein
VRVTRGPGPDRRRRERSHPPDTVQAWA